MKPKYKQLSETDFIQKHEGIAIPTGDNDGVDTAGLGKKFRVGDEWTFNGVVYVIKSNVTGNASWIDISSETKKVKVVTTWTLDTGTRYYHDFTHNLASVDLIFSITDEDTGEQVWIDAIIKTSSNVARFYVEGNTHNLRIVIKK